MNIKLARVLVRAAVATLTTGPAFAQVAEAVDQAIANQTTVLRRFTPPQKLGTIDIEVEDQRERVSLENAQQIRFMLQSLTVEGAETIPSSVLAPAWQGMVGRMVSLADLYAVADEIEAAYRRAGYFSKAVVPVQDFKSRRVVIKLYESYVRDIVIKGATPEMEARLAPYIDRIVAMRPIRIKELERVLLLMSDLGGVSIEGTLKRPEGSSGGGELTLEIGFDRLAVHAALDNLGSASTGPLEASGVVVLNDTLRLFDTTTLVGVTVPDTPKELAMIQASHDVPIGSDGLHAGFNVSYVSSRPGADLAPFDIEVESTNAAIYASYPFLRTIERSVLGRIELNYKDNAVDVAKAVSGRDHSRWIAASMRFDQAFDAGGLNLVATAGLGIDGLGASGPEDDFVSRAGVPENYHFVRLDADVTHALWNDAGLHLRAAGQYSPDPLPAAVQMALGGDPYGRAFDGSTATGDSGIALAVEVSQPVETGVPGLGSTALFAFADYGVVWNHDVSVDYTRQAMGSIGIGVRGRIGDNVSAQALVAVPWEDELALTDTGTRLFFKLAASF